MKTNLFLSAFLTLTLAFNVRATPTRTITPLLAADPTCPYLGPELLLNGDLEAGNINFTSGYTYVSGCAPGGPVGNGTQGNYFLENIGTTCYSGLTDHYNGNGKVLHYPDIAKLTANKVFWQASPATAVSTVKTYVLSFWVYEPAGNCSAMTSLTGTKFEVWINSTLIMATDVGGCAMWYQKTYTWTGDASTAVIRIENGTGNYQSPNGTTGMDLFLDDISFKECLQSPPSDPDPCCVGNYCRDNSNPLSDHHDIPLGTFNYNFSGTNNGKVNVGYSCGQAGIGRLNAQTSVKTNLLSGGYPASTAVYGLNSYLSLEKQAAVGVTGEAFASGSGYSSIGVLGYSHSQNMKYNIGVSGVARPSNGAAPALTYEIQHPNGANIGLYATGLINLPIGNVANPPSDWAAWFDGNVRVNGSGYINTSWLTSDKRFKTNIKPLSNIFEKLNRIQGYSYTFNTADFKERNFDSKSHLGLLAQEVIEVFPELVTTDAKGYYAVDYQGMIPVLIQAIKEQQTQIQELQAAVADSKKTGQNTSVPVVLSSNTAIVLNQNVPNPFAESTVIDYSIPVDFTKAQIIFSTTSGSVIRVVDVTVKGQGSLNIFADDLTRGTYIYSLVIDGKTIETKKMIKQ